MKKLFLSVLVFVVALMPIFATPTVVFAETNNISVVESKAYNFTKEFVTTDGNNDSNYELRQANRLQYLKQKALSMGYIEGDIAIQNFRYSNRFTDNATEDSANLIITKKANIDTDKYVIISANYDNAESLLQDIQNTDGTTANGVGVGVVLALMEELKEINLNFNVKFVFFGASEVGLKGSKFYVEHMTTADHNNLLLMINVWGIGAGDKTYIYDDEMHWEHYEYISNLAINNGLKLNKMPVDKKVISALEENIGLEYNHQALLSDVAPFIAMRLPTISFFSGNFNEYGFVQSASYGTLMGTKNDTLEKFDEIFGENGKAKMNEAVTLIENLLTDGVFEEMMARSIANKPNYSFFTTKNNGVMIVTTVVCLLLILAMVVVYFVLKDKAKKSNDPIKPMYIDVDQFIDPNGNINGIDETPHEDPFGLDDNDNNNPFDL